MNSLNIRGSGLNSNFYYSIPNSSENVKYNKFWVHTTDIKNADGSQTAGASEGSITGYQTSVDKKVYHKKRVKVKTVPMKSLIFWMTKIYS